jgi:hypothetical protein
MLPPTPKIFINLIYWDQRTIDLLFGPLIYEKIYSRVTLHATSTVQRISNAYSHMVALSLSGFKS